MVIQGLIRPPPEIRVVADRTALYVAKNGRTFETRILNSAKGQTPKFAFLHTTSPFHAYYEDRIQHYESNGGVESDTKEEKTSGSTAEPGTTNGDTANVVDNGSKGDTGTSTPIISTEEKEVDGKVKQAQKSSAIDPIAKAILSQRAKISDFYKKHTTETASATATATATATNDPSNNDSEDTDTIPPLVATTTNAILPPPSTLNFLQIVAPASLSLLQLETIQITAQLIAISSFVSPTINLLQDLTMREWNNPIFRFCQPRHGHFAYFSALVDAYKQLLTDWSTVETTSLLNKTKNNTRFYEMESMANNVHQCLEKATYRAEYQRDVEERLRHNENDISITTSNKINWHDFVVVETIDFAIDEVVANLPPPSSSSLLSSIPPPLPPPQTTSAAPYIMNVKNDSDMDDDDDDDGEMIRVVPTYTPKLSGADSKNAETIVIDPISGKSVAVKDMPEHMRIQLLDPKWAEERKKFQEKQKESNLVGGDMVASNLQRFAQARGDQFGKKVCRIACVRR
jgi:splicing factor 3A subunit 1